MDADIPADTLHSKAIFFIEIVTYRSECHLKKMKKETQVRARARTHTHTHTHNRWR